MNNPSAENTFWPAQLIVLHGDDREQLCGRLAWLLQLLDREPNQDVAALARTLTGCVHEAGERLAIVAADGNELRHRCERALERLEDSSCERIRDVGGIYYDQRPLYQDGAKLAMLYPGEGAQYLGMLGDLLVLPEVRECFEQATNVILGAGGGATAPIEFTAIPEDPEQRASLEASLKRLDNAMLTVLVADWALTRVLEKMGVPFDAMAGHSAGELSALVLADALNGLDTIEQLVRSITELESSPGVDATLLAIGASRDSVEAILMGLASECGPCGAELAMDNCPHQAVVVGLADEMTAVEDRVRQKGMMYERLELARPYHTALFEPLMEPLRQMFSATKFRAPRFPVYSCTTGQPFPEEPEAVRELCISHWRRRVEFVKMIRQMHADGVRIFVEVGPRGNLCSFVDDILRHDDHLAVPADVPRRNGMLQLLHVAAQLFAHGVPLDLSYFDATTHSAGDDEQRPAASTTTALSESTAYRSPDAMRTGAGQVMQEYLRVMDEFLATQQQVMTQFLRGAPNPVSRINATAEHAWNSVDASHQPVEEVQGNGHPHPESSNGYGANGHASKGADSDSPQGRDASVDAGADVFAPNEVVDPMTRPMLGEMLEYEQGVSLSMRRALIVEEDIYADHHTVGGRSISRVEPSQHGLPIMPLTFTVEMIAEVGLALLPDMVVRQVKNVQLMRWLAFEKGDPGAIELAAHRLEPDENDQRNGEVRVLVQIRQLGTENKPEPKRPVAAVGTVVLGSSRLEPDCEYAPLDLPGCKPCDVPVEVMYNNLFHGELFTAVDSLDVIAENGIEGTIHSLPREGVFRSIDDPMFIGDPVLLDVAMHPPVAWHLEELDQEGRILLPFELERLDFFGRRPPPHHPMKSQTRIVETTPRHFAHLTEVFDGVTGKIWARIYKVKLWRFYFPFRDVNFHGPKDVYFFSTSWDRILPEALRGIATCSHMLPLDDLRGPALLSAAARVLMSPREFARFENLDRPADKKPQFLFGRIAAKDAVRLHRRKTHDERWFYADVEIDVNDQGRPVALARGQQHDDFPTVSISHCDRLICALAADHPWVGIDLEPVVPRESSFERIAFSSEERNLLDKHSDSESRSEWVARFWCAKEAVSKALGEGLVEGPRSLHVVAAEPDGRLLVKLGTQLAAQFPEFADEPLVAWTNREDDFVVAASLCWLASQESPAVPTSLAEQRGRDV